jgi:hypothetical protein
MCTKFASEYFALLGGSDTYSMYEKISKSDILGKVSHLEVDLAFPVQS